LLAAEHAELIRFVFNSERRDFELLKRKLNWLAALTIGCAVLFTYVLLIRGSDQILTHYLAGQLSKTLTELEASGPPKDVKAVLLAANCYRQLGQQTLFNQKIEQAKKFVDSKEQVEVAMALYRVQQGQADDTPQQLLIALRAVEALESDARSVAVQNAFARDLFVDAKQLLEDWRHEQPDSSQLAYLSAVFLNVTGDTKSAESKFIDSLVQHPRHELTWLSLIDIYGRPPNTRFEHAETVLRQFVHLFPHNEEGRLRLSRIQRRLGLKSFIDVPPLNLTSGRSQSMHFETEKVAFDLGHYDDAVKQLSSLKLDSARAFNQLTDRAFQLSLQNENDVANEWSQRVSYAATALSLSGDRQVAMEIFEVAMDRAARLRRLQDLKNRQLVFPGTQSIIDELNSIVSPAFTPNYPTMMQLDDEAVGDGPAGMKLYVAHCAACHGVFGDGHGPAASDLFPPARNFLDEPIRMVSASNRLATNDDLRRTIRTGQPGTSMPAFPSLSEREIDQLVEVVRWSIMKGLEKRYATEFNESTDTTGNEKSEWIATRSLPSDELAVSLTSKPEFIAQGRELFMNVGCATCHAVDGISRPRTELFDSLGRPIHAPNLSSDPLHGGDSPAAIYTRIALGIPGTPHPAYAPKTDDEIASIVAYVTSIRRKNPDESTNQSRRRRLHSNFVSRQR